MPRVRLTRSGEFRDVDEDVADYLCASGSAVRQDDRGVIAVAVADVRTTADRATARPARRRPRERR